MNRHDVLNLFKDWVNAEMAVLADSGNTNEEYDFLVNTARPRAEALDIPWDQVAAANPAIDYALTHGNPTFAAHLHGGSSNGLVVVTEEQDTFNFDGDRYVRRSRAQHPDGFVEETGGPNAGHWIYDHWGPSALGGAR